MSVDINYLAVILAAVSSMIVGSLWYMQSSLGKTWMRLSGVKPHRSNMSGSKMVWMYGSVFVASLVTAYVLANITFLSHRFFGNGWLNAALDSALWLWLGFTAARLYVHDTFENRRKKLTIINAAYELLMVLVMALIIGWLHP